MDQRCRFEYRIEVQLLSSSCLSFVVVEVWTEMIARALTRLSGVRLLSSQLRSPSPPASSVMKGDGAYRRHTPSLNVTAVVVSVFAYTAVWTSSKKRLATCEGAEKKVEAPGRHRCDLREIPAEEVKKHRRMEEGVWVTFDGGVYDVTEFVEGHPGGSSMLLLAAGGPLEAYWNSYPQHFQTYVFEMLEEMRIGNLKAEDQGISPALNHT